MLFLNNSRAGYDRLPSSDDRPTTQYETDTELPTPPFPRISKSLEHLKPSYDCVVIGSGYGGAIAASRMARSAQSVCVLERGQEKWPGEYPATFLEVLKELRVSGIIGKKSKNGQKVTRGKASGMYHIVTGKGQSAVVCNGKQSLMPLCQCAWNSPYNLQVLVVAALSMPMFFLRQMRRPCPRNYGRPKFGKTQHVCQNARIFYSTLFTCLLLI